MRHLVSFVFAATLSIGCVTVPGTERKAFNILPVSQEHQMGADAYRDILKKEKLSKDARLNGVLQRVGQRIAQASGATGFPWEFSLIESPEMNAFCLPGGKVAFYTGILPVLKHEAGMALVMGHEVAHAVARHGAERVSQGLATQFGLLLFDAAILKDAKYRNAILAGLGLGAQVGVALPFSRAHESEADRLGLEYAARAGYDPTEGAKFWERFASAKGKSGMPEFLSTHPADGTRIRQLREMEASALVVYEQSPKFGTGEKL